MNPHAVPITRGHIAHAPNKHLSRADEIRQIVLHMGITAHHSTPQEIRLASKYKPNGIQPKRTWRRE